MHKILIFGNSGSGKSTLAKKLAQTDNLAHLDLDILAWLPTDPPQRAPLPQSKIVIDEFVASHNSWVIEGGYTDLLEIVSNSARKIIFLNLNVEQCVQNAQNRSWEAHKYPSKEAQDNNLEMLLTWIREYAQRTDQFSHQAHMNFYDQYQGEKIMYTSNQHTVK